MTARTPLAICCVIVLAACAGSNTPTTDAPPTPTPASSTTAVAPSTSTSEPSVVTSTATTNSTVAPAPMLDDGRPSTFMAVTDDYEAVEVDTATGAIIQSFGQRADAAALASEDEISPNVVDGVWRSASGDTVLISECCEPAGGHISFLTEGERLDRDYENEASQGWWVVPSAHSDHVIITGYITEVVDASRGPSTPDATTLFENDGSGVGAIGWSSDGATIYWLDESTGDLTSWKWTSDGLGVAAKVSIDWIGSDQHIFGLDSQSTGNLVSFRTLFNANGEPVETEGVVYSPEDGELLAKFPVAPGSAFGGYDLSGKFLIYTTRDGIVMYQGSGQVGVMGAGFLFASW